jgi:hypothetical protein
MIGKSSQKMENQIPQGSLQNIVEINVTEEQATG